MFDIKIECFILKTKKTGVDTETLKETANKTGQNSLPPNVK